jgi:hypothetical protein
LSFAYWMNNKFLHSITFGSFAVLWTGWPFVGLILLPIGLHMLYSTIFNHTTVIQQTSLTTSNNQTLKNTSTNSNIPIVSNNIDPIKSSLPIKFHLYTGIFDVCLFIFKSLCIVTVIGVIPFLLDSYIYQKWYV